MSEDLNKKQLAALKGYVAKCLESMNSYARDYDREKYRIKKSKIELKLLANLNA